MGLERVVAIKEGVYNNFDSSVFTPIIQKIEQLVGDKPNEDNIGSYRVISDHIRAISFMISDGVLFDKVGRGYVLRRILRRAVRHGYLLGIREPFMFKIVDTLSNMVGSHYTQIPEKLDYIKEQIELEEQRFFKTIDSGMTLFNQELANTKDIFSGEVAFMLYDTHGFPLDLTQDMLRERNLKLDIDSFDKAMDKQKAKAKAAWKGSGDSSNDGKFKKLIEKFGENRFVGYDTKRSESKVLALLNDNFDHIDYIDKTCSGWVMFETTPFYATSGGQTGDVGVIETYRNIAEVIATEKFSGLNLSKINVTEGTIETGVEYDQIVINRDEVAKHHSATHLLQSALKVVLGDTVSQAGSLNDDKRLRFDFTYPKAMTKAQLDEVEDLVNSMIAHSVDSDIKEMPIDEAKKTGAISMFGEKYGDIVRVVKLGDSSVEFCGGTHVKATGDIGSFYITKESGVGTGVRRIEAVCGLSAISYTKERLETLEKAKFELKNQDVFMGINKLKNEIKTLKSELSEAQKVGASSVSEEMIGDTKVVVDIVQNGDIKQIVDDMKNQNENIAILLLQPKGKKVMIVSGVKGCDSIKAGDWIKTVAPVVGGGGGGRPDFAQAGGKDVSKIDDAKQTAIDFAKSKL
jgi:alanyl-tRNA synthetase